jgi:hypothetical protein
MNGKWTFSAARIAAFIAKRQKAPYDYFAAADLTS